MDGVLCLYFVYIILAATLDGVYCFVPGAAYSRPI